MVKLWNEIEFTQQINVIGPSGFTGENNLFIEIIWFSNYLPFDRIDVLIKISSKHNWEQNTRRSGYFLSYDYVHNTIY